MITSLNHNDNDETLVSVIVITYNSAHYVVETLNSIVLQSYLNIELIISDDGSSDNTVEICEDWLRQKRNRFFDTQILKAKKNSGIPANCNRGVTAAKGKWIKLIAGDDLLDPVCLTAFIEFAKSDSNIHVCVSDMYEFLDGNMSISKLVKPEIYYKTVDVRMQYKKLLRSFFGNAPAFFVQKQVLAEIPYDEDIKYMEDYPFALNLNKNNIFIYYLPVPTVHYRIRNNSASNDRNSKIFSDFYKRLNTFNESYRYPDMDKITYLAERFEILKKDAFNNLGMNRNTPLNRYLFKMISYLNPFYILSKIK